MADEGELIDVTAVRQRAEKVFDDPLYLDGIGAILAGTANVILQLGLPPVGYGVMESKVDSGRVDKHPIHRFRTTFTYIAVAMLGTDDERSAYREAVNGSHRLVRSDADSPVKYNAFDPALQLWVAACLYYGTVDLYERLHGPMDDTLADAFYAHAARFGTTLQVPAEGWPADRAAFAEYWANGLAGLSYDEPTRRYLLGLVTREHMPRVLRGSTRFNVWITSGFLPQPVRERMGLSWSDRDDERLRRLLRVLGALQRRVPKEARRLPFNLLLLDLRRRRRTGRALV